MTQYILMDIEGTTTSIAFVKEVLFPYATQHLGDFIRRYEQEDRIQAQLQALREGQGNALSTEEIIQQLLTWIEEDRKHTALKALQGYLWKKGYENGDYRGHIYEDVVPALERWDQQGHAMGIYSSGSVEAQQLLFRHSDKGDLTGHLSDYFDTKVGPKREVDSYYQIQSQLGISAPNILFLSDVVEELDAAAAAGFQTTQLVRADNSDTPQGKHVVVESFEEIGL